MLRAIAVRISLHSQPVCWICLPGAPIDEISIEHQCSVEVLLPTRLPSLACSSPMVFLPVPPFVAVERWRLNGKPSQDEEYKQQLDDKRARTKKRKEEIPLTGVEDERVCTGCATTNDKDTRQRNQTGDRTAVSSKLLSG
jgi:hypothetical protein